MTDDHCLEISPELQLGLESGHPFGGKFIRRILSAIFSCMFSRIERSLACKFRKSQREGSLRGIIQKGMHEHKLFVFIAGIYCRLLISSAGISKKSTVPRCCLQTSWCNETSDRHCEHTNVSRTMIEHNNVSRTMSLPFIINKNVQHSVMIQIRSSDGSNIWEWLSTNGDEGDVR